MDICLGSPSPLNDESAKKVNSQDQAESQKILRLLLHSVTSLGDFLATWATSSSFGSYFLRKRALETCRTWGDFSNLPKLLRFVSERKLSLGRKIWQLLRQFGLFLGRELGHPVSAAKSPKILKDFICQPDSFCILGNWERVGKAPTNCK